MELLRSHPRGDTTPTVIYQIIVKRGNVIAALTIIDGLTDRLLYRR